jgi:hypothetical protein
MCTDELHTMYNVLPHTMPRTSDDIHFIADIITAVVWNVNYTLTYYAEYKRTKCANV